MATISSATAVATGRHLSQKRTKLNYINGLNSFGGLKAHNHLVCPNHSFAKVVYSLKTPSKGKGGKLLPITCNAATEIFKIASIIPGLVLVGVAVGFVLLRIEAFVEESE